MPHVRIIETLAANIVFLQPANRGEPYFVDDGRVRQEIRRPAQAATPALNEDLSG